MVSIREIRRLFREINPERQLTTEGIAEFKERSIYLIEHLAKICEIEANRTNITARLTEEHVKLASLIILEDILE